MAEHRVTVFGGSGFLGRYIVRRLAERDWLITAAMRDPAGANFLKTCGDVGQVATVAANITDAANVARAVAGADTVINLVGILYEHGRQRFQAIHVDGAEGLARTCARAGVRRLIHFSALGADKTAASVYARTKGLGEEAVRAAFPGATIFRPSIVIGAEDDFMNRFAEMARLTPALPLIGGGTNKFQPVVASDVAAAVMAALDDPAAAGQTYEIGGPRVYTFKELMEVLLAEIGRHRLLLPLPFGLASFVARFAEMAPQPALTRDQVTLLRGDNVVTGSLPGLGDLGVTPCAIETILPTYLARYRPGGRLGSHSLA